MGPTTNLVVGLFLRIIDSISKELILIPPLFINSLLLPVMYKFPSMNVPKSPVLYQLEMRTSLFS